MSRFAVIETPIPRNQSARVEPITLIVAHATDGGTGLSSVDWQRNGRVNGKPVQSSYHVIIEDDGKRLRCVQDTRVAWHAGASEWDGRRGVNAWSLGFAFAIRNNGREPITPDAWASALELCREWMGLHAGITGTDRIVTHAMVSPGRKSDLLAAQFDLGAFRRAVRP